SPENRIVGNVRVDVSQADLPYICSVRYQTVHRCSATILNPNWLLTSGHCTTELPIDAISIVCGIRMYRTVLEVVPHPDFDAARWTGHDLALLRMRKALNFTSNVQPIPLVDGAEVLSDGKATIVGYDLSRLGVEDSSPFAWNPMLQMADVPILSSCECQQRLGPVLSTYLADVNICTDNVQSTIGGTSTCVGDSGAPVMIATELQPYNLLAIPSWTLAPCGTGPSVHVRVAPHLDWILAIIAKMKSITLGVLWAISFTAAISAATPERRILGGTDAFTGELPYQVSIQRAFLTARTHVCGGTILNPLHVLTAASCFWTDSTSRFEIVAGNLRIDRPSDTQQVLGVFWIRMHPGYTGGTSSFDVAVIRTSSAFFFTDLIRPVTLPAYDELPVGLVRVGGWGSTSNSILPGNNFSNVLQKINVLIVPWNECLSVLGGPGGPFDERNICTGPLSGGISTCTGDAGGGAIQHLGNDVFLQVGIITWNVLPCVSGSDDKGGQQRIIGGVRALPGEFPAMVSIQRLILISANHVCGGTVLNQFHVLTAAQCFFSNQNSRYRVQAGKVLLNSFEPSEQTINVLRFTMHPQYDGSASPFDIATVRLASPFGYNQYITPINLPPIDSIPDGIVKFAGWGSTSNGLLPSMSDQLQMFQVGLVPNDQCQIMMGGSIGIGPVTDRNVCLGPATGGIGACTGDAGGAAIQFINGFDTIVGIISWQVSPCGQPGIPTITTRVSAFIEWINLNSQI
uniref:Peptidase S1 domain-containing protein n=1 Tax=Anopheles minimus TaxID=112268 RepID=A0A182WH14_9DIPT